jgi:hypothetical protein
MIVEHASQVWGNDGNGGGHGEVDLGWVKMMWHERNVPELPVKIFADGRIWDKLRSDVSLNYKFVILLFSKSSTLVGCRLQYRRTAMFCMLEVRRRKIGPINGCPN